MMNSKYRFLFGIILLGSLATSAAAPTQGHCAKVSREVTLYFGIETSLPDPNHPVTVDAYHTDFDVSFLRSGWDVAISYEGPSPSVTHRDLCPEDALLYGNTRSRWLLSAIPAGFEFLGVQPGHPFWVLPQNAGSGALPLGLAAERADTDRLCRWNPHDSRSAANDDLWFEVRLLDMRAPAGAQFALWQIDGVRPPVVFMSTHEWALSHKNVCYIAAGSHMHLNWGFTQPGRYALRFRISTVLRCDDWLTADCAPAGDGTYHGDGCVDFQDFAWVALHWLQTPRADDPETFMFANPEDPADLVGPDELMALAEQWLKCGYPGCYRDWNPDLRH